MRRARQRLPARASRRKRHQVRKRAAIALAKYRPGQRVTHDFGKVPGIARQNSRVAGVIIGVRGRFLATPELAEWVYTVELDAPFCSETRWSLQERRLELEKTQGRPSQDRAWDGINDHRTRPAHRRRPNP